MLRQATNTLVIVSCANTTAQASLSLTLSKTVKAWIL
jgi:hypothetical protein